jgi:hypothetical protein
MPKVFIIILNWNGWSDTMECLSSLNNIIYDNFEVILIDNGSKEPFDFAQGINQNFQNLKITTIYNKKNLGFAGGNNQGIKIALERGAEYVLLLNNDTTVEPDFLTKLVEVAESRKDGGIFGPMTYFYDSLNNNKKLICSAGGRIIKNYIAGTLIGHKEINNGQYNEQKEVDYISGACLLIKREVVNKIGLISEDYFLYYEDGDWCVRAIRSGYKCIFVPDSVIYHKVSRSTQEFSYSYIYYHSRNGMIFSWRFGFKPLTLLQSVWIILKQIIKLIIGYKRDWARPVMKGVIDFWWTKKGKLEGCY